MDESGILTNNWRLNFDFSVETTEKFSKIYRFYVVFSNTPKALVIRYSTNANLLIH